MRLEKIFRFVSKPCALLIGLCFAQTIAFAQRVSLSVQNTSLVKVCKEVEKQTGYYFVYAKDLKEVNTPVTVDLKNEPVQSALTKIFKGLPYQYEVIDKVVSVNTKKATSKSAGIADMQDTIILKGIVVGEKDEPLPGASVMSTKTKRMALTNEKGQFEMKGVALDEEVVFSYIGYTPKKTRAAGGVIIMVLEPSQNQLDQVQIRGYGKTSQRYSTGSITTVQGKEIEQFPVMNPLLALQGKVPGMTISQVSANPSDPIKIEIRGRGSLNSSMPADPLIIIDGIPITVLELTPANSTVNSFSQINAVSRGFDQSGLTNGMSPLFGVNVSDIESISVLKDADATAIYGSRGANGVIIINTKRAKAGRNNLTIGYTAGITTISKFYDVLNTTDYLNLRREAFANDGLTPSLQKGSPGYAGDLLIWDTTRYTNWQKYLYGGQGSYQKVNANYSGGTDQNTYSLSGNYTKTKSITSLSGDQQSGGFNMSVNSNSKNKKFRVMGSLTLNFTKDNQANLMDLTNFVPNAPSLFKENGEINFAELNAVQAMGLSLMSLKQPIDRKSMSVNGSFNAEYQFTDYLTGNVAVTYSRNTGSTVKIVPISSLDPSTNQRTGQRMVADNKNTTMTVEPGLRFSKNVGNGLLTAQLGSTYQSTSSNMLLTSGSNYLTDDFLGSLSFAPTIKATEAKSQYKYVGTFFRAEYIYEMKYMLNLSGRRDGSSKFGPGKQYGNFGAIGAGWVASEEEWLKGILPKEMSLLKFYGSYGITGEQGIGDYQYLIQWATQNGLASYEGDIMPLLISLQANDKFHWSNSKMLNLGINLGFFNDRLTFNGEWYRKISDDQLISFPTGSFTGFTSYTANSPASVLNTGVNASLSAHIIQGKKWNWRTSFTASNNRNELLSYPSLEKSPYYSRYVIGKPIDEVYVLKYTGIDPQTGKYTYLDANKDGSIKTNYSVPAGTKDDDRVVAVTPTPRLNLGGNTGLSYKNISVDISFYFKRMNAYSAVSQQMGGIGNVSYEMYRNRWTHPGQNATAPRATTNFDEISSMFRLSDGQYEKVNVFRINQLSMNYMLPSKYLQKAKLRTASLGLGVNNLLLITNYQGVDPEVNYMATVSSMPPTRTYTITLSVGL
ncbi:TonB-linked SusC/RagA family outer membrane protein [Chitinophaga skermanii]|uniref:TonB-linked SusC/RagA family outer membrane protein n=1 Tax=Chitinophaga skermanii TaxID=331697 RepID=A0A327QWZ6_9BACT|nr:SusC/RagA family TonB-linked outer membrane protein [Chitinophaga skermanii]RAJ08851.1 TonB-linked SusC/RagA family outer membrane protein [Chitinophaga skermanii]